MGRNLTELNRATNRLRPEKRRAHHASSVAIHIVRPVLLAAVLTVMGLLLLRHLCASRLTTGHWWP